jgi:hypothetical protein
MKPFLVLVAFITLALSMTSCIVDDTGIPPAPVSDYSNSAASQQSRADDAMQQAQQQEGNANAASANETAQAEAADRLRALAAAATDQALGVARAQLAMTADASNFSSTQAAVSAQQTAQAVEVKATLDARVMLLAQEQARATATAQAMQLEGVIAQQMANTSQRQRELISWLIPIVLVIVFGVVVLLGAKFISGMIDSDNERRSLENKRLALLATLFLAPSETIVFADHPHSEFATLRLIGSPDSGSGYDPNGSTASFEPEIDSEEPPVIVILSTGEKILPVSAEAREEAARCKLAMKLLRDAINHEGAQSNRIPPAAKLGWPAGAWTIAVAILRPYGVEILPGADGGTYLVGQYPTLQAIYITIGERRLLLYPPLVGNINIS